EGGQRATQEMSWAALPVLALGSLDVAEVKAFGGAVAKLDLDPGRPVGHHHQITPGPERGVVDRPERRHHDVAVGEPDALFQPSRQLSCREPLAADDSGEVA